MTPTFHALNRFGNLLASFNALDLAERYKDQRAALGIEITIRRVIQHGRAA